MLPESYFSCVLSYLSLSLQYFFLTSIWLNFCFVWSCFLFGFVFSCFFLSLFSLFICFCLLNLCQFQSFFYAYLMLSDFFLFMNSTVLNCRATQQFQNLIRNFQEYFQSFAAIYFFAKVPDIWFQSSLWSY